MFLEPPACRRTAAAQGTEQKAGDTWQPVRWDKPGMGAGAAFSYDSTGGAMSQDPYRIVVPIPGLYEISTGVVVRSVSGGLPWAVAAVNRNVTNGEAISTLAFLRFGLGRSESREKSGAGSATIFLDAGDYVSLAVNASEAFVLGVDDGAQALTHLEVRWTGARP
ncbi:hypothetical protein CTZ27_03195 [Streptomyces griseocarneus]|nr:hypothetical protein CTZ27_03195 [Streptomyces griseocarneus]